ncbi:hypothetical protein Hdeb2414_s0011g00366901 [Helianthus debilis subsp. tardiflorus]
MQDQILGSRLPTGVIRGCDKCTNCQKVTAKWRPEEARVPILSEAPAFYPTEEVWFIYQNLIGTVPFGSVRY